MKIEDVVTAMISEYPFNLEHFERLRAVLNLTLSGSVFSGLTTENGSLFYYLTVPTKKKLQVSVRFGLPLLELWSVAASASVDLRRDILITHQSLE